MFLKLGLYAVIGYLIVCTLAYLFQRNMLYYPDTEYPDEKELKRIGLKTWPETGSGYKAVVSLTPSGAGKGVVVVFHGNAGAAWHRYYYVQALEPLGYRVVLAEYPGYGGRGGELGEESFVSDGKQLLAQVMKEFGGPLFLWGESLGSGVAAAIARDPGVPVSGVVMLTPWDSLANLAQKIYWFLPVRWMLRDKYDTVKNLQEFRGPVAVVVAERDEIVPKEFGLALYEALCGPKRLWVFPDSGHNDWPSSSNETWWKEVMEFLEAHQG